MLKATHRNFRGQIHGPVDAHQNYCLDPLKMLLVPFLKCSKDPTNNAGTQQVIHKPEIQPQHTKGRPPRRAFKAQSDVRFPIELLEVKKGWWIGPMTGQTYPMKKTYRQSCSGVQWQYPDLHVFSIKFCRSIVCHGTVPTSTTLRSLQTSIILQDLQVFKGSPLKSNPACFANFTPIKICFS